MQSDGYQALVTVLAIVTSVMLVAECTVAAVGENSNDKLVENIVVEKPMFKYEQSPSLIDLSNNMHGPGGKCLNFTPTFCDMIDYKVAAAELHAIDNTENGNRDELL